MPDDISVKEYIDIRIKSVEDKLDAQMQFFSHHFELTAIALEKSEKDAEARRALRDATLKVMEERIASLETTRSFSAGKMWMVMAGFAVIPTIIAIVALFR